MSTVIQIEHVGKQYRLGAISTGTLSHDLNRFWHRIRGKEDPYLKISEVNDRSRAGSTEYVWALRDVNLEVKQGEIVGVIGRNGAGKSTLLKILSRTTTPTTGSVKIKGRIASLLEVGTGFHPELTGRENIFLNGAILGMKKSEIRSKFDQIVSFAEVERYIDTPVKRYSSGMYVRLAFAVAAHLDPDILVVDEVLAVGDAEFQKKALGRMKEVSGADGRTVLFVSHNMTSISQLTTRCVLMQQGSVEMYDRTETVVAHYGRMLSGGNSSLVLDTREMRRHVEKIGAVQIVAMYFEQSNIFPSGSDIRFNVNLEYKEPVDRLRFSITIFDHVESPVGSSFSREYNPSELRDKGCAVITLPNPRLSPGIYIIAIAVGKGDQHTGYKNYDVLLRTLQFEVVPESVAEVKSNASVWLNSWGKIEFDKLTIE